MYMYNFYSCNMNASSLCSLMVANYTSKQNGASKPIKRFKNSRLSLNEPLNPVKLNNLLLPSSTGRTSEDLQPLSAIFLLWLAAVLLFLSSHDLFLCALI